MSQANLSETLFKPSVKDRETSTLVNLSGHTEPLHVADSALEGVKQANWYRTINVLMWTWRGIDPIEIEHVLSRIAASDARRSDDRLLDTVIGYRSGNWAYEWSHQAMEWQRKAGTEADAQRAGEHWLKAATLYSIAGYPHLKGDDLAEQAGALSNRAYEEAAKRLSYELKELSFPVEGGRSITGFLHMPSAEGGPFPTVIICNSLDMLQSDNHRLFRDYLAPRGIAMLTVDMPSVGFSSAFKLTQDSSRLHQAVLNALPDVPWIDHTQVSAFGLRFGANVAMRLAYLESRRLRSVACLGPIVHSLLCDQRCQDSVPGMYIDVLASRMGMDSATATALRTELNCYSLKTQGLLGRRCATPVLAGFWKNDPFSPEDEAKRIVSSSADGKLLAIPSTPVYESFDRALHQICDWIQNKMR